MMLLYMCKNGGAIADKIFDNMATQSLFKGNEEHMGKIRSKFKGGGNPPNKCSFDEGVPQIQSIS